MTTRLQRAGILTGLICFSTVLVLTLPGPRGARANEPATVRFGEIQLKNGLTMSYAERGSTTGQVVILLHGYSDSWFSYSRVLELFSPALRVYALDQRGHGNSARPKSGYSMTDMAADVIQFMDAKGIRRATVIGHSMGSFIAQRAAQTAPDRVQRLVLIGTATSAPKFAGMQELKSAIDGMPDPVPESFIREFQVSTVHNPLPAEFMERVIAESRKLPLYVWQRIAEGLMTDVSGNWSHIRIPTLIVRGQRDTYATAAEQDALQALIPGARQKTYSNIGHALHWERPAEFVRDVEAFLKRNK